MFAAWRGQRGNCCNLRKHCKLIEGLDGSGCEWTRCNGNEEGGSVLQSDSGAGWEQTMQRGQRTSVATEMDRAGLDASGYIAKHCNREGGGKYCKPCGEGRE